MSLYLTNLIKKELQNCIEKNNLKLSDFEFSTPDISSYIITYKHLNDFLVKFEAKIKNEIGMVILRGTTTGGGYVGTLERTLIIFEDWLRFIESEISISLHENISQDDTLPEIIDSISPKFRVIYHQSLKAENEKLDEICGMGYRKALEFIVKDYLVKTERMTLDEAKGEHKLMKCINLLKDESDIFHKVAQVAANLGNEFTHYHQDEKAEIKRLKELIGLFVSWVMFKDKVRQDSLKLDKESNNLLSN